MIARLDDSAADFDVALDEILKLATEDEVEISEQVQRIIADVKSRGDAALIELTNRFDHTSVSSMAALTISQDQCRRAFDAIPALVRDALIESSDRVRDYHIHQKEALGNGEDWSYTDELGNLLGQRVGGMNRVGIYVPGGKAAYPSTIIMTAIPARVAGVREIVVCVPMPRGEVSEVLLAAAHLCQVDQVFALGGAQAIAAMAFGTESIRAVDKIVGPGNVYVAKAKAAVYGQVGIDMIAGPSEVVIVADEHANVDWIVQDMFAQAEHDEMAQAILITDSSSILERVATRMPVMMENESRARIIAQAISHRGAIIKVTNLESAIDVVNRIAPEHLQLAVVDPEKYLPLVQNAGAVFLGVDTAEVVGDYTAGPSHVLPTGGTARFTSPLGVYDFQVRSSVIKCSRKGSIELNRAAAIIAREEGLFAHAESAACRVKG